jgi:hypothetical protein
MLCEHCHQLVLAKLPALSLAPTTIGASQIANSLGKVEQLWGVCQDTTTCPNASAQKTPQDHYRLMLEVWLQLAHVVSEANMLPVHSALATNDKKQTHSTWE